MLRQSPENRPENGHNPESRIQNPTSKFQTKHRHQFAESVKKETT